MAAPKIIRGKYVRHGPIEVESDDAGEVTIRAGGQTMKLPPVNAADLYGLLQDLMTWDNDG